MLLLNFFLKASSTRLVVEAEVEEEVTSATSSAALSVEAVAEAHTAEEVRLSTNTDFIIAHFHFEVEISIRTTSAVAWQTLSVISSVKPLIVSWEWIRLRGELSVSLEAYFFSDLIARFLPCRHGTPNSGIHFLNILLLGHGYDYISKMCK